MFHSLMSPMEFNQYKTLYLANTNGDLMSPELAQMLLMQTQLSQPVLSHIWNLTMGNSNIFLAEFVMAMYLCTLALNGGQLPMEIPSELKLEMQKLIKQQDEALKIETSRVNPFRKTKENDWAIPTEKRIQYDIQFHSETINGSGYFEAARAYHFFKRSGLDEQVLASIWNLADPNNTGRLDCDGFAIAMYLIEQAVNGVAVPTALPNMLNSNVKVPSKVYQPVKLEGSPQTVEKPAINKSIASVSHSDNPAVPVLPKNSYEVAESKALESSHKIDSTVSFTILQPPVIHSVSSVSPKIHSSNPTNVKSKAQQLLAEKLQAMGISPAPSIPVIQNEVPKPQYAARIPTATAADFVNKDFKKKIEQNTAVKTPHAKEAPRIELSQIKQQEKASALELLVNAFKDDPSVSVDGLLSPESESVPSPLVAIPEEFEAYEALAIHNYQAQADDDLTVSAGTSVTVNKIEDGWAYCQANDKTGFVPLSYLTTQSKDSFKAKVLYDFESSHPDEMSVKKDVILTVIKVEGDWAQCNVQSEIGYVPFGYLERLTSDINSTTESLNR